jgi:hypothetical protein
VISYSGSICLGLANRLTERLEKTIKWRGVELIKIHQRNLTYISKLIRHVFILARPRPRRYKKTIALRTGLCNLKSQRKHTSMQTKPQEQLWPPKSDYKTSNSLMYISLNTLRTRLKSTVEATRRTK